MWVRSHNQTFAGWGKQPKMTEVTGAGKDYRIAPANKVRRVVSQLFQWLQYVADGTVKPPALELLRGISEDSFHALRAGQVRRARVAGRKKNRHERSRSDAGRFEGIASNQVQCLI